MFSMKRSRERFFNLTAIRKTAHGGARRALRGSPASFTRIALPHRLPQLPPFAFPHLHTRARICIRTRTHTRIHTRAHYLLFFSTESKSPPVFYIYYAILDATFRINIIILFS
jgi:hypothetical protein